jgi:hypothetical protein
VGVEEIVCSLQNRGKDIVFEEGRNRMSRMIERAIIILCIMM